ncbi:putative scytonemin-related tyrosinase [Ectocarpus siliculosus]|uniref:Scytonemin-related tyrosinase n=1 Tax=Ectocarpus siliculosus TaxID=2880 RepID=D7FSN5_ECTSI|nr:putative scytonemin-related tyrosinase [Ectocarpus siliculosus]|eukprot:CBJ31176.1 putative scytonemin-related tyrosinase [Ectocarpus siliculosus]
MAPSQSSELYPWTHLAEPYKKSLLAIDAGQDDYEACARWEVDGVELGTGPSVETVFRSPGIFPCTVTVSYPQRPLSGGHEDDSPETSGSLATVTHKFEVTVKYVRREIRDLTDRDRETFFNAVSVLQRVPSAVGREIYGDKYYSKDYFNRLHLFYGGHKDCDHWHDGAGFVTSHIALSLMYEQALQSVSPSIALPYWDFTIEGMLYDWRDFRTSSVFSDDWFGKASPRNVLMTPSRGRFGFVPVMANATEYSTLHNPYGLLRSPWNTHPEPFLTRHDRLFGYKNNRKPSGCKQYRDAARKDTWMLLTESMNAGAHGHIHELLGGAWSSDWSGFYNRTEKIILPFAHTIVPLMKYLWRTEYLQCETTCDFSVSWADCRCTLSAEAVAGQTPSEVLESSGVLSDAAGAFFYDEDLKLVDNLTDEQGHAHDRIPGYTADETKGIFTEMLRLLSTPMRIGSHYEGTSTNDVTFWVLHPTMDRLWHLNRLEDVNGEGFDETWRDDHFCYGHNPADVQPFHDLFLGQATGKGGHDQQRRAMRDERDAAKESGGEEQAAGAGTSGGSSGCGSIAPPKAYYTNQMLYELLKPDGMSIPYMYAHFEWPHCDVRGVHLRGREPRR